MEAKWLDLEAVRFMDPHFAKAEWQLFIFAFSFRQYLLPPIVEKHQQKKKHEYQPPEIVTEKSHVFSAQLDDTMVNTYIYLCQLTSFQSRPLNQDSAASEWWDIFLPSPLSSFLDLLLLVLL